MKKLVEIEFDSGEIELFERIELAPNAVEYRRVPCEVVGNQQRPTHSLTLLGFAVAIAVFSAEFGLGKLYDALLGFVVG